MKFKTNGLIIKEQSIGEQDRLVTVLTASNGIIRAFVKGAKNIKNQKCASTQLLCYSRMTLNKMRDSYIIGDAKSEEMFIKLRSDIENMCLAQYFCELAAVVCPREQNAQEYLTLTLNSIYLLANKMRNPLLIKACYEMRMMSLAGYMPDLTMCRECGCYESDTMYFLPKAGCFVCGGCANTANDVLKIPLNKGTATALRHTIYADEKKLFSFSLPDEDLKTLNTASETYIKQMLERDFSTLQFYKTMCK